MKVYYHDDYVTLYHGNAAELSRCRGVEIASVLITDPPYGLGIDYGVAQDNADLVSLAVSVVERCLPHVDVALVTPGLANVWAYPKATAIGCWHIPGNPGRGFPWSHPEWEPILVYTKRLLGGSSVFRAPVTNQVGVGSHPCPKPLALMQKLVAVASRPDDVILDPFAGSGTTLVAAKAFGRRVVGIELNEEFCEIAASRCSQEVLELAV